MSTISIFGFPPSTYTQTALLAAAEVGAGVELKPLAFKEPTHFALHPHGKMPAMTDGELTLYETLAIVSYLNETHDGALEPDEPIERATVLQHVSAAIDYVYEDLVSALHGDVTPELTVAAGRQLALLDAAVAAKPYMCGSSPTMADLFYYPMIEFAVRKLGDGELAKLRNLTRWRSAMAKRPSVAKVMGQ